MKKIKSKFFLISLLLIILIVLKCFIFAETPQDVDLKTDLKNKFAVDSKPEKKETGLDLTNVIMKSGGDDGSPNIHSFLGCEFCHSEIPSKGFDPTAKKPELIKYENESTLCETCHAHECLHPSEIDPLSSNVAIEIPTNLPLGIQGKSKRRITCMTCHEIHGETFLNQLIRGFPMSLSDTKVFYKTRLDFCVVCHSQSEKAENAKTAVVWNIHKNFKEDMYCKACHKTSNAEELKKIKEIPDKKEREKKIIDSLRSTVKGLCAFCHIDQAGKQHFLAVNAFADKNIKENRKLEDLGLVLLDGKITCITCHNSHGTEENTTHYLRASFIQIATMSSRINPHRRKTFCLSCHTKYDEKGKVTGLKFEGELNKICTWCHDGKEARADIHPINVVLKENEYMKKPQNLLVTAEGKLTCYTCHYTGYGECEKNPDDRARAEDTKNKNHLRGWPFEDRWDQCYRCHVKREFKKFNAHYQMDSTTGKMIEESCLFCHSSRPEIDIVGMEKVKFKGIVIFICLGCHPDTPHPGRRAGSSQGVNHLIQPVEVPGKLKIPEGIPLSDKQRLHCGSCHNPHAKGVIKSIYGKGAGANDRKRFEKCTDCHISK
ncbi:hypothetical protein HZA55_10800 [Candidatus Poribacteria bacterium]|nr:hypothetical protein [Candidatus Poribacteria bacterium]